VIKSKKKKKQRQAKEKKKKKKKKYELRQFWEKKSAGNKRGNGPTE